MQCRHSTSHHCVVTDDQRASMEEKTDGHEDLLHLNKKRSLLLSNKKGLKFSKNTYLCKYKTKF